MKIKTVLSNLICPECGNVFIIPRIKSSKRSIFHRKWLYCYICKKETNHIEIPDLDKYISEIEFKKENNRNEDEQKIYCLIKGK